MKTGEFNNGNFVDLDFGVDDVSKAKYILEEAKTQLESERANLDDAIQRFEQAETAVKIAQFNLDIIQKDG